MIEFGPTSNQSPGKGGKMNYLKGIFLVALISGITASRLPLPEDDDVSRFFDQATPGARIVGGNAAAFGSHPHMVALTTGRIFSSFLCGGSVISTRTVLTAAHCIEAVFSRGSLSSTLRGTVGTLRWNSGGQSYSFRGNATHPNYLNSIIKNDLGVLYTTADIVYSVLVSPISLSFDYVPGGVLTRVAGWGRIRAGGSLSAVLLELWTSTIDGQRCVSAAEQAAIDLNFRNVPPVEPHIEICTFHSAGQGNCNGDSGSALIRPDRGVQVGIVSWGFPCALGAPDMYVRVSAYRDWLLANTE